jgi:hypothetical protein
VFNLIGRLAPISTKKKNNELISNLKYENRRDCFFERSDCHYKELISGGDFKFKHQ